MSQSPKLDVRGILVVTPLYTSRIWKELVIFFEGDSGIGIKHHEGGSPSGV